MRTRLTLAATAAAAALALSACGGGDATLSDPDSPLRVGASPVPHAEILQFVADELAEDAGLEIEIVPFTDYVQPNVALDDGSLDANYFQHVPYLEDQMANAGFDFVAVAPIHLEPIGLYSARHDSLDTVPQGARVAIPNDPTNGGRALRLLEAEGLLTLEDTDGAPTALDVADNPLGLDIIEVEAAQVPRSLQDVDLAVINGNYAIEANLSPATDALALEDAEGNPNANVLVVRAGDESDERITKLAELLQSEQVRGFIEEEYAGAVIPAF